MKILPANDDINIFCEKLSHKRNEQNEMWFQKYKNSWEKQETSITETEIYMQIVSSMPKELKSKSIVPMSIEPIELKPVMVNLEYLITSFTQTFRSQYSDCTESVILIIINIINFH